MLLQTTKDYRNRLRTIAIYCSYRRLPQTTAYYLRLPQITAEYCKPPKTIEAGRVPSRTAAYYRRLPQTTADYHKLRILYTTKDHRSRQHIIADYCMSSQTTTDYRSLPQATVDYHQHITAHTAADRQRIIKPTAIHR